MISGLVSPERSRQSNPTYLEIASPVSIAYSESGSFA